MYQDNSGPGILEGKELPPSNSKDVDGSIRLDLAAGHFRQAGWIAVDLDEGYSQTKPDVVADIRALPFPDNYADEARAIHVIEHFYAWEALDVVKEWVRVIKPGAQLAIECPSLEKVLKLAEVPQIDPRYTYWALYGDPRHGRPEMTHKWCYTPMSLVRLMTQAGLVELRPEPPKFHFPVRDIRVVGVKPKDGQKIVLPGQQ